MIFVEELFIAIISPSIFKAAPGIEPVISRFSVHSKCVDQSTTEAVMPQYITYIVEWYIAEVLFYLDRLTFHLSVIWLVYLEFLIRIFQYYVNYLPA